MEKQLHSSEVIVLLQTHALDLIAQVEASARHVREVQRHAIALRQEPTDIARGDALHAIRENAAALLRDYEGFCATLRDVQELAAQLSPERRHTNQFVMWDRRRQA
jgi:hypothetical protein